MTHATAWALDKMYPWLREDARSVAGRAACSWGEAGIDAFTVVAAEALLAGQKVDLPTCPACAALLDLALEMRGASVGSAGGARRVARGRVPAPGVEAAGLGDGYGPGEVQTLTRSATHTPVTTADSATVSHDGARDSARVCCNSFARASATGPSSATPASTEDA